MELEQRWPVRIYYEDTDHGGVVYHANYLRYMERARTEFLRTAGIELDAVQQRWGVIFAVTRLAIDYRTPARFNDLLQVVSTIERPRGARLRYHQQIVRQRDEAVITDAAVDLACIDTSGKPRRIPSEINAILRKLASTIEQGATNPT